MVTRSQAVTQINRSKQGYRLKPTFPPDVGVPMVHEIAVFSLNFQVQPEVCILLHSCVKTEAQVHGNEQRAGPQRQDNSSSSNALPTKVAGCKAARSFENVLELVN